MSGRFQVTAHPKDRPPVQLVIKQWVSLVLIPQVGTQVVVGYNPEKPKEAIILSKEYTDKLGYTGIPNNSPQSDEIKMLLHNLYNPMSAQ